MQANRFKEVLTQEDLKLGFQHGFEALFERQKRFFGYTRFSDDPSGAHVYKNYIVQ